MYNYSTENKCSRLRGNCYYIEYTDCGDYFIDPQHLQKEVKL